MKNIEFIHPSEDGLHGHHLLEHVALVGVSWCDLLEACVSFQAGNSPHYFLAKYPLCACMGRCFLGFRF